jgi:hypothetical protein
VIKWIAEMEMYLDIKLMDFLKFDNFSEKLLVFGKIILGI